MYPPREGDLPRDQLMERAKQVMQEHEQQGIGCEIHFKFTCEHCGRRCMLADPNTLHLYGECDGCGQETEIKFGGFTVIATFGKPATTENT
jgi:hypothetical protein